MLLTLLLGVALSMLAGAIAMWFVLRRVPRMARGHDRIDTNIVAERVRAVGRLVGLEVCAKEIATARTGWDFLPPLLLSPARLAMIFHFEKQYSVDLSRVDASSVRQIGPGRFRLTLPPVEGSLRLVDVSPYDIQDGRVLGLLDVIQMNAQRQSDLMQRAQADAAKLFRTGDDRYALAARRSIERQIASLLGLFGVEVCVEGSGEGRAEAARARPLVAGLLRAAPVGAA